MDGAAPSGDPAEAVHIPDDFFKGRTYHIASSFPPARAEELDAALSAHGATRAEGVNDLSLNLVIADSPVWEGWEIVELREREAREKDGVMEGAEPRARLVEVVTDKWVDRSLLTGKLQLPQHYSTNPSHLFSGVVACGTGLPTTDLEVISGGITGLGGQWRTGLTKEVTHLFAISPGTSKFATALHYQADTGIKVLLPHWFDDAVRLGVRDLDTAPYEWPEPIMLKQKNEPQLANPAPANDDDDMGDISPEKQRAKEREEMKRNMYATAALFAPAMNTSSPPSAADISLVSKHILNLSSPLCPNTNTNTGTTGTTGTGIGADTGVPQIWAGRRVLLSRTLQLYQGRREAVQKGIERAGGVVVRFADDDEEEEEPTIVEVVVRDDAEGVPEGATRTANLIRLSAKEEERVKAEMAAVEECDVLVTRWRYGRPYIRAVRNQKTIGTLAWLFHVQSTGVLTRPLDQLLHYPVPKRIIEGFSNHKITVTNYTGEAREYLKKLIAVMGAEFTPSMSIQNTVLIAAHTSGTKANKAHSWSIPVVNHTWLEDCFVQWRNLTPALERYIVFPPGVDFSSLLGGRGLWVGSGESVTVTGSAAPNGVGEKEKEAEKEKEKKKVQTKIEIEAEDVSSLMDQEEALVVAYEQQQQLQQATANPPTEDDTMQPPDASAREVQALMGDVDPDVDMDAGAGGMDFEPDPHAGEWEIPAYLTGEANEEVEEEDEQMTPKAKAKAKEPTKSPAKTSMKPKSKPKPAGSIIELNDSSDEEELPSKKPKAKATAASKKVAEKPVSSNKTKTPAKTPAKKSPVKTKAPARAVSEVTSVEDDPEDEEEVEEQIEEEQDQDEEDENMDADETEDFPSRVLPRSKASNGKGKETPKEKAKPTPSKSAGNAKRRVLVSSTPEEVEDEGSDEEKEEEEVEVVEPKSTSKAKAKATEKKKAKQDESPESTLPKKRVDAKTTKSKRAVSSSSSSEDEQPKPTPKSKVQPTLTPLTPMPSSSVAKATPNGSTPANTSSRAGGLLNRPKVDARTRVKKKVAGKEKIVVESEDEEEEEEVKGKGKGKKVATPAAAMGKKAAPMKKGKNKKAASSSEEEEEEPQWEEDEEDEEEMRPKRSNKSKSAAKPTPSSNTPAKSTPNPKSQKQTTSTRSKPLRVYSEPPSEVESEDEDPAQIDEDDEDEDESLPPAPHLLSKSEARRAASAKEKESEKAKEKQKQKPTATASVGRPKPGPASKTKGYMSTPAGKATATSKSKAKAKHAESETEEDGDSVEEVIASKPKGKQTPAAASSKGKSTAPAVSTPKRVMSVLLPSLKLSAVKPSVDVLKKGKKKVEVDRSDEEEDVVVTSTRGRGRPAALTAKPKLSAKPPPSKSTATAKPAPKSKAKGKRAASPEEEEESGTYDKTRESEQEEEEVSVLVSPRTRAVVRTESLRALADQTAVASPSAAARTRGTSSAKHAGKSKVDNSKSTTAMDVDQPVAESSSHPKRNAATKATQRLRDTLMPDLISFEAQMRKARRTSGRGGLDAFVVEGVDDDGYGNKSGSRKRGSTQDDDNEDEGSKKKKRRVSGVADEEDEVVVVVRKDVKGKGKGKEKEDPMDVDEEVPSTGIMVMTTQVTLGDDTIKALAKLGVKMTTRPGECTHLLARQVVRTEKFLCALASSPYILSEKWALASAEAKRLLPEKDFILKDKAGETKYGIDLVKSLRRAKENKGKLLDGHIFYVTPKVPVDTKLLKSVVNACGGQVTTQTPSVRIINAAPETRHVISCKDDISIWRPIASLGIKIYTQEFLLNGALNQKMEWDRDDLTVQV